MHIIPVIDLREGQSVRAFVEDDLEKKGVYRPDPIEQAIYFEDLGATRIHIADLDGAFSGRPRNLAIAAEIAAKTRLEIDFAGGLRTLENVDMAIDSGASRVIIGTMAIRNPKMIGEAVQKYGEKIGVGIDCKDNRVVVEGWETTVAKTAPVLLAEMVKLGVKSFVYSDVSRDGKLVGPNYPVVEELLQLAGDAKVVSCGGVATLGCIKRLKEMGVDGVIIGKAFYAGILTYEEAVHIGG